MANVRDSFERVSIIKHEFHHTRSNVDSINEINVINECRGGGCRFQMTNFTLGLSRIYEEKKKKNKFVSRRQNLSTVRYILNDFFLFHTYFCHRTNCARARSRRLHFPVSYFEKCNATSYYVDDKLSLLLENNWITVLRAINLPAVYKFVRFR